MITTTAWSLRMLHRCHYNPAFTRRCTETICISKRALSISADNTSLTRPKYNHITIIGGGIAGLSTARYLLRHDSRINVTIIDKHTEIPKVAKSSSSYPTYDEQQIDLLHYNIPSRRNGNVLCPSLTVPWTTRSLWSEVFLPFLKSRFVKEKEMNRPQIITFDVPALLSDRNMVSSCIFIVIIQITYDHLC